MMIRPILCCLLCAWCILIAGSALAQQPDRKLEYAVGINVGALIPKTDIPQYDYFPYARTFARYYPIHQLSLEFGIGMGTLEAESGGQFFSSVIYPIDFRLLVEPLKQGKINPFFFVGLGLMYFNPSDKAEQPLPRNANGEYSRATGYFPLGLGAYGFIGENTSLGVTAGYNYTMTDNLDDIKSGGHDYFWSLSLNLVTYLKGGSDDLDLDGLLNDDEKRIGTDPLNPDTDADSLHDGDEVHKYHTDPLKKDTDADGLTDGEEVLKYHTDPLKIDTDGDGLNDGDEVSVYHTDPLKADTDGDGLSDGDEVLKYHTDPLKIDTDGDSLTDLDEVLKYHTDPLKKDTDGDGLSDADELFKYKTNPLLKDTDKGGVDDGKEIELGLNPLDPNDDVPIIKVGERIILEGVNFQSGKTTLLPAAAKILDQVALSLASAPSAEVAIHGHTDNIGGAGYNMRLSLGRAEAVKTYLVSKGVRGARVTTKGFGFTKPISDNSSPAGRAKNRRIEFVRLK